MQINLDGAANANLVNLQSTGVPLGVSKTAGQATIEIGNRAIPVGGIPDHVILSVLSPLVS